MERIQPIASQVMRVRTCRCHRSRTGEEANTAIARRRKPRDITCHRKSGTIMTLERPCKQGNFVRNAQNLTFSATFNSLSGFETRRRVPPPPAFESLVSTSRHKIRVSHSVAGSNAPTRRKFVLNLDLCLSGCGTLRTGNSISLMLVSKSSRWTDDVFVLLYTGHARCISFWSI